MVSHLCHLYNGTSVTPARNVCHYVLFLPSHHGSRLLVRIAAL